MSVFDQFSLTDRGRMRRLEISQDVLVVCKPAYMKDERTKLAGCLLGIKSTLNGKLTLVELKKI